MNQPTLKLPRLRADQYKIAVDTHKIRVVDAGRRWGKTTTGSAMCLTCASAGYPVLWCAPQFKNTRALWRAAERAVAPLKAVGVVRVSQTDRVIEFPNGGFLVVASAENADAILGDAYKLAVVDEAARVSEEVILETILPTLADYDGELVLIGTPRGMSNLFYALWLRGQSDDPEVKSWRYPTTANPSPHIQKAVARARKTMSERQFLQEWEAVFLPDGAGVFVNVDKLATAAIQHKAVDGHRYAGGLDFGRSVDFTALVTFDLTENAIVNVMRLGDMDFVRQRAYIKDAYERFDHSVILAEQNSIGMPMIEELQREGVWVQPFITTNATKAQLVDTLALQLQNEAIRLIPDPVLLGELKAYGGRQLPSGLWHYTAPSGMHDDTVIAAMLAVTASKRFMPAEWDAFVV